MQDNTDGTFGQPFRIFAGVNNILSLEVDALGDIRLANGGVFIDRSLGNVNIGSTTETCCELFVTGDSNVDIGLKVPGVTSLWKLNATGSPGQEFFNIGSNAAPLIFALKLTPQTTACGLA